jgi:hypothetical protein
LGFPELQDDDPDFDDEVEAAAWLKVRDARAKIVRLVADAAHPGLIDAVRARLERFTRQAQALTNALLPDDPDDASPNMNAAAGLAIGQ